MTADPQREFVDASVLVYAFDASAGRKQRVAQALVERLWESNTGCVNVSVNTRGRPRSSPTPTPDFLRLHAIVNWQAQTR